MSLIHRFSTPPNSSELPTRFPNPFSHEPHPLAQQAAMQLQGFLTTQFKSQPEAGQMFAVLVVQDEVGTLGFLAAFSGQSNGHWCQPGFVPPVFDPDKRESIFSAARAELAEMDSDIKQIQNSSARQALVQELDGVTSHFERERIALQARHKERKAARRSRRQEDLAQTPEQHEQLLACLSQESQQDRREWCDFKAARRVRLTQAEQGLAQLDQQILDLKLARDRRAEQLRQALFDDYVLLNAHGEQQSMAGLFPDRRPPDGAGDCAAPKLLHFAYQQGLRPIALAQFWWGESPKASIRHHGYFYPPCRSRCHPILPFMLRGLALEPWAPTVDIFPDPDAPATVYEDEDLVVVNKPSGMLSVPGKQIKDSVLSRMRQRYPTASGPLLLHRLDMSTSGLILVAKDAATHKALQRQFLQRSVEKRYVSVLSKRLPEHIDEGVVELPLRVDLDDRPRQLVCHEHGKPAKTRWQIIERHANSTRVYFYPVTGRTHQLRVHAAHPLGLNAPIVGDELYGRRQTRLLLHAEALCFTQPRSGRRIEVEAAATF